MASSSSSSLSLARLFRFVPSFLILASTMLSARILPPRNIDLTPINSICQSTPHPELCIDTFKIGISDSINATNPTLLTFAHCSVNAAISEATKLSSFFSSKPDGIVEAHRSTIQDCKDLHDITISSLQTSLDIFSKHATVGTFGTKHMGDVNTYLSAAITNKNTCLQGLSTASGPKKVSLIDSLEEAYRYVSNTLAIVSQSRSPLSPPPPFHNRRLMGEVPDWLSRGDRKLLGINFDDNDGEDELTLRVSADGSERFTTITEAVQYVPTQSNARTIILVKAGVYEENVEIPSYKMNVALIGQGNDVTVIRGGRSYADGWTPFKSATVAVSSEGFLARDITIENYAGPEKGQAVALRINADHSAVYRCNIVGYQDTLLAHSFRQFYRECNILGTIDFIFGNAAVVIQNSNIIARMPNHGQSNVITAQGRDDKNEETGISIQRCSIFAASDLATSPERAKTYLGRPWKKYSRTVYMDSSLGDLVDPAGWLDWDGDKGVDTLYYGEYANEGPGSSTDGRVKWPGYHIMGYDAAAKFTVSEFIDGDRWLDSTTVPYDDDV